MSGTNKPHILEYSSKVCVIVALNEDGVATEVLRTEAETHADDTQFRQDNKECHLVTPRRRYDDPDVPNRVFGMIRMLRRARGES